MAEKKNSQELSDDLESLSLGKAEDDGEFEPESGNEDFEDYRVDGYHPVVLGEVFNSKYQVIQKLGWGHFSTVWLVNEKKTSSYYALKIQKSKKAYTESAMDELEILKTLTQNVNKPEWHEIVVEWNRTYGLSLMPEDTFNIRLLDNFQHYGMHGKHCCLVFEIMGPSLLDLIQYFEFQGKGMDIRLVKIITRQVLMGLDYMHRVGNVIHTDLKPENIMLELRGKELEQFIADLKEYKRKPLSMKFLKKLQTSGKNSKKNQKKKLKKQMKKQTEQEAAEGTEAPAQSGSESVSLSAEQQENSKEMANDFETALVKELKPDNTNLMKEEDKTEVVEAGGNEAKGSTEMQVEEVKANGDNGEDWSYTLKWKDHINVKLDKNTKIKIVDFGNACWVHKHFTDNIQTREYRSPEAILRIPYQENTDIWSFACIVFEMVTSSFLFKPKNGKNYTKDDDHLALMIEVLGRIPKDFALKGKSSGEFFNKSGQLLRIKDLYERSLFDALMQDGNVGEEEAKRIEKFLLPMLEYDPEKRMSAHEALKSEWLWS